MIETYRLFALRILPFVTICVMKNFSEVSGVD